MGSIIEMSQFTSAHALIVVRDWFEKHDCDFRGSAFDTMNDLLVAGFSLMLDKQMARAWPDLHAERAEAKSEIAELKGKFERSEDHRQRLLNEKLLAGGWEQVYGKPDPKPVNDRELDGNIVLKAMRCRTPG